LNSASPVQIGSLCIYITANVENMEIQPISKTSTLNSSRNKLVNSSSRQRYFVLNFDRALAKKIEASRRDVNIQYEYTGGGVTGTIDAVTFELAKNAIMHYYEAISHSQRPYSWYNIARGYISVYC
jgi:ribosomal protein S9